MRWMMVFLGACAMTGCGAVVHSTIEQMAPPQRSVWIASQNTDTLCGIYRSPAASRTTQLMLETTLQGRRLSHCGGLSVGSVSRGLRGTHSFSRAGIGGVLTNDRDCTDFTSASDAQQFFLARGGPALDRHHLDPDGDGLACNWAQVIGGGA